MKFSTLPPAGSVAEPLRVCDVLRLPAFEGAEVVAGRAALKGRIDHVNVMQIPTDRFAKPNELLLAAATAFSNVDPRILMAALGNKGIAALAVRSTSLHDVLGSGALAEADSRRIAVIALPESTHLSDAQTAVLEHLISSRARDMKAAADVREELSASALAGGGLSTLAVAVASTVDASVWILDEDRNVMAASGDADPDDFTGLVDAYESGRIDEPVAAQGFVLAPISVPYRRLGYLVVALSHPLNNRELAAIEHATMIAALQLAHQQSADEATLRFRSGFVRDLSSGTLDSNSAGRRAASVGWNTQARYRIVLVDPCGGREHLVATLANELPEVLVANHAGALLLMVPDRVADVAENVIGEIATDDDRVCAGVSRSHEGLRGFSQALMEAQEARDAARTFDRGKRVRHFASLGPLRFLISVPTHDLQRFVENTLRPLNELEDEYRATLEETLRHLIDANLNVAQAARNGGWHYNTLRYRIERLTELLGPFMDEGTILDSITLALILRDEITTSDAQS